MKKLFKGLLTCIMSLSLCACGGSTKDDKTVKSISVGISPDYAPYELKLTDGTIEGFDIDMMNLFEGYLKEITGEEYKFELVEMEFDAIISQIQGDQVQVGISGFTYEESRKVEWSNPYLGTSQVAVFPAGSDIKSAADLEGKVIAAQTGATGEGVAKEIKDADVKSIGKVTDIFTGLAANQYDVAIVDLGVAKNYVANGNFEMLDEVLLDEANYIIAKEGNKEVIELMNKCIEKFLASEDYSTLCTKHGVTEYSK